MACSIVFGLGFKDNVFLISKALLIKCWFLMQSTRTQFYESADYLFFPSYRKHEERPCHTYPDRKE